MAQAELRPLIAGNWKMNGTTLSLNEARLMAGMVKGALLGCDIMVCPPATLIHRIREVFQEAPVTIGGQDCHWDAAGAHTGDISAEMLKDAGCSAVIAGHSERRTDHAETDAVVSRKAAAAHRAGLTAIICIGETLAQRKAGQTLEVLSRQLKGSVPALATAETAVIAYEPVWAIGTGVTASSAEVAEAHAHIRARLSEVFGRAGEAMRILYGGSVKPSNAGELMAIANVNGALVGGASLNAVDFIGVIKAYT